MARRQHRRRNFSTAQWAVFAVGGVAGIGLLGWGVYRYVTKEDEAIPPAPAPAPTEVPTEVATTLQHPDLGAVEIVTFPDPDTGAFTWRAEWAEGSTFASDVFATADLAFEHARDQIATAYGPWEPGFGEGATDTPPPTGTGTFEYRGATMTVESAPGLNFDWSATVPWGISGAGTEATTGAAHEAARTWIDENVVAAIQART